MGVIEREGENRTKRFRCAIERHGVRFERWFHTREQAENAWILWDKKLIDMFGRRSNKKIEALNARRCQGETNPGAGGEKNSHGPLWTDKGLRLPKEVPGPSYLLPL